MLGDGSHFGIRLSYAVQPSPDGLAQAFLIGEEFIGDEPCAMILGDNIFYGNGFSGVLRGAVSNAENGRATVFGYYVPDPERFGVVEFDENKRVVSIEEKPQNPKSNFAVPGLYFYDNSVVEVAKTIQPSARGELEITTVNNVYLQRGQLLVSPMGRGMAWLDTGTPEGMLQASQFVATVQNRQGFYISCIEEIAWRRGWINDQQLLAIGTELKMTDYGQYLISLVEKD